VAGMSVGLELLEVVGMRLGDTVTGRSPIKQRCRDARTLGGPGLAWAA
jgi:hypothetical protein